MVVACCPEGIDRPLVIAMGAAEALAIPEPGFKDIGLLNLGLFVEGNSDGEGRSGCPLVAMTSGRSKTIASSE